MKAREQLNNKIISNFDTYFSTLFENLSDDQVEKLFNLLKNYKQNLAKNSK